MRENCSDRSSDSDTTFLLSFSSIPQTHLINKTKQTPSTALKCKLTRVSRHQKSNRLRRYIGFVLTYLLTYLQFIFRTRYHYLLRLEPGSLMIKKSRLRWFGHVEHKDDTNWVKHCMTLEVEGIRQSPEAQRLAQRKAGAINIKDDMESSGLS